MANGQDPNTQVTQTIDIPDGAIGATIADEQPSKAKQFFTDPKNLATMLVLASALAQPRRSGRKPLAHALRAGTGALAFRGGLDKGLEASQQQASEAASVIQDREEQQRLSGERTGVLESQVAATTRGQDIGVTEGVLDREGRKNVAQTRLEVLTSRELLENDLLKISVEGYYKAYSDWLLSGSPGSPPDPNAMIVLPEGMTIGPRDSGADIITPGGGPTPDPLPLPTKDDGAGEAAVPFGPITIDGVPVTGQMSRGLRKDLPAASVRVTQLRVARKRYPDVYKDASDEEIFDRIASVQAEMKARLDAGMTQDDANLLKRDKFMLEHMTRDQRAEVLRIARGPSKTPNFSSSF